MNRLVSVIGLAPSELPFEEFVEKLRKERVRVTNNIARWKQAGSYSKKRKRKKKVSAKDMALASILAEAGMTLEELKDEAVSMRSKRGDSK